MGVGFATGQADPYRAQRAIATIILDRPARANTITMQLTVDFNDALDELEADREIACILVTGAGEKHFCGGADLREIEDMITEEGVTGDPRRDFVSHIEAVAKPVIAVINGAAMGAAVKSRSPAISASWWMTRRSAFPKSASARCGAGGTQRLPRLVGLAKAKELILLGGSLSAREALAVGLVTAVASREALDRCVEDMVGQLVGKAPYALAAGKALLSRSLDLPLAEDWRWSAGSSATWDRRRSATIFVSVR